MRPTAKLVVAFGLCSSLALATLGRAWLVGPAVCCLVLVLALAAIDFRRTMREPALELRCELPPRARLREPFLVSYQLHNPLTRALTLRLLDERGAALGGDLALGPLELPAHARHCLQQSWCAEQRGLLRIGPLHGLGSSRLGLFERRFAVRADAPVLRVLPNPGSSRDPLHGLTAELGIQPARTRGAGMEVDSLRRYTEGDDPRHVDWRASARAQQLIVRSFRAEHNQSLLVAVDTGRMMAARVEGLCKLDHALNTTVALAHASLVYGDRLAFAAFDVSVRSWLPSGDPKRALPRLLEATLPLAARPVESSFRVLTELLESSHKKRSLVVILSDFVETADALSFTGYLARLARRHVVLLVALRDPRLSSLDEPVTELDEQQLYERLVLQDLAAERQLVLRRLTRLGVHTLDLRPEQSRAPVLERYLALRQAL
jgi:uncharacterized protein (DUF58 family)